MFFKTTISLLLLASTAVAQKATAESTTYRRGRYLPLRVETETAGSVTIEGSGILPIEWVAAGRSSAVVPLLIVGNDESIIVNGKAVPLGISALGDGDLDPPKLTDYWQHIDPRNGPGVLLDSVAYDTANLWQPGRTARQRTWMLTAIALVVLALGVARHAKPKQATRWLAVTAAVLIAVIAFAYPADTLRRVVPAEARPAWEWVWYAGGPGRVTEPWVPGLRYVWPDMPSAVETRPVLRCDAAGRPVDISAEIPRGGRAVFIRPRAAVTP